MKKYICSVCGYIYDEAVGIPERGTAPGTKRQDSPYGWSCPLCGAAKNEFKEQTESKSPAARPAETRQTHAVDMRELSFGELSALLSNLSKGCEKQYRPDEAGLFSQLAEYYRSKSEPAETAEFEALAALMQKDLADGYPSANDAASEQADRGALRSLVWGEKVTRILSSLLSRYEKQKEALLVNTNIYVCEICGFVYLGDEPPEICPVCKVPNTKIRRIDKEAV